MSRPVESPAPHLETRQQLEMVLRMANLCPAAVDLTTGRIAGHERWDAVIGNPEGATGSRLIDWEAVIHPEDRPSRDSALDECREGRSKSFRSEYRVRRHDGAWVWVSSLGEVAATDPEGRPTVLFVAIQNVDGRRRAEEEMREQERRNRAIDRFLPALTFRCRDDENWTALYCTDGAFALTGYPAEDFLAGRIHYSVLILPEDRAETRRGVRIALEAGRVYEAEHRIRHRDGSVRWVWNRMSGVFAPDGSLLFLEGMNLDITERKRQEEELKAAEAADRAKGEFLANVSHEIRTPMNAILGMAELAMETPLTADQRRYLGVLKSAADSLLVIIEDLLDEAKMEAGRLELVPAAFSLRPMLGETLKSLAIRAGRKGVELVLDVLPDVPDHLVGDAGRLRQVLVNLVGNAIKFTERGEVVVEVSLASERPGGDGGTVALVFWVRDTGVGIAPEAQGRIFDPFEQADSSPTRTFGGTGLGLTIASRIAALMGGGIRVESEPGRGSTFEFSARFGRGPDPVAPGPVVTSDPLAGRPILIVDDNEAVRRILERWLLGRGMVPEVVPDGESALEALRVGTAGRPFELAVLDGRLKNEDGVDLAEVVAREALLPRGRIVMLSPGDAYDPARLRGLGVASRLLKPVCEQELIDALRDAMSGAAWAPDPPLIEAPSTHPRRRLRILVAEDNEFNWELLDHLLSRWGHSTTLAGDGRRALSLLEGEEFDLMLLDLNMPGMDGLQVVRRIRDQERLAGRSARLPVIALTASARPGDRALCLEAGMDEYLTKPLGAADLLAAIDRVTAIRSPEVEGVPWPLNPSVLLAACGEDAEMLVKLCRSFPTRAPEYLIEVQKALSDGQASRLREMAHKSAGLLSAFSTPAGDLAASLEELAAGGRLEEARALVDQLGDAVRELLGLRKGLNLNDLRRWARR